MDFTVPPTYLPHNRPNNIQKMTANAKNQGKRLSLVSEIRHQIPDALPSSGNGANSARNNKPA
jgi:hypothetical protein